MKYNIIMESGQYALILRGNKMEEYAVVNGLNKERGDWCWTVSYYNFGMFSPLNRAEALMLAADCFLYKTMENYISRSRLEELATKFKDGLIEQCMYSNTSDEEWKEFINNECEMTDYEKEFFGIEMESEE